MADIYVRSTDGNNADNGSTWALAKATLLGATAIAVAGDTIWVSQVHAESDAAQQNVTVSGTKASPIKVICANDGAAPPTAVALTATLSTTAANAWSFSVSVGGGHAYYYGLTIQAGSGGSAANLVQDATGHVEWEKCSFSLVGTGASLIEISLATTGANLNRWKNCTIRFSADTQAINIRGAGTTYFHWQGGSIVAGSSSPNPANNAIFVISSGIATGHVLIEDVDFSIFAAGVHIHNGFASSTAGPNSFVIRNCKLPASWSGLLVRQAVLGNSRYSLYNCSAGAQNYKLWIESAEGTIRDETTLVRANGATDGTTPISWKLTTGANANYPANVLLSDDIFFHQGALSSPIEVAIHILHDSATNLKDDEAWIEVSYLGVSGTPLGTFLPDAKTDPVATGADQAASLESWTTTGLANPNKQKLSVSFTPQMSGFFIARVALAKASKTIYACPKVEVV